MKNLLYIGNQLSHRGKTPTNIDTLSVLLKEEGFGVKTASNKSNKLIRLFDMLYHIIKHRRKTDFVLIDTYSTQNFYYAYLCSQICRVLRLKYLPILHGGNLPSRLKRSPKLSKAIFNNAYINVAPSLYTKSNFENLGYHNIICIPNTIELKNYPFKERTFNSVKLLWVRSFSKIYNPLLAIQILRFLKNKGIKASLCMVGPDSDGSLQEAKAYAQEQSVEVTFTGKLSKKEWIALSRDYNIFINTTNFDNMPVSVIEAMALGLPVVSTNVGGIPFFIKNNENGMLVEPNSVNAFVQSIKKMIAEPSRTSRIIFSARKYVEAYDWNVVKNQWLKAFK